MATVSVSLYTKCEFEPVQWFEGITSEQVCVELCKKIGITQATSLLFSLRVSGTNFFIPACRTVTCTEQYDFRLRFQISQLSTLRRMDMMAYAYFYHQATDDLIGSKIPELVYPLQKDQVAGLFVTNMYNEMVENRESFENIMENYKQYVPEVYIKKHSFAIKKLIIKALKSIENFNYKTDYVKETFLESIKTMAPYYLTESCQALVSDPSEKNSSTIMTPVDLEIAPFHEERPGLSIYYRDLKLWKHISRIEDIYAIIITEDKIVKFEMGSCSVGAGFKVEISNKIERESFVSCICGYYRLMVKWAFNLCRELSSPSLKRLQELQSFGPIGGDCAYTMLEDNLSVCGNHIVRQCEECFEQYYIDIITEGLLAKTYKITYHLNNVWLLHMEGIKTCFETLSDLINSIDTDSKQKHRILPAEHDKFATLLLCLPATKMTAKKALSEDSEYEMRSRAVQIISPVDIWKYIRTNKFTNNGITTEMKADWMLPDDMKLEVNLKTLINTEYLSEFIGVAQKWGNLNSPELIKLYGYSLSTPATYVIESMKLGPLDEFLRDSNNDINVGCMVDAAYSLARALHYLHERNITHGRIRCASLKVIRYDAPKNLLMVRLGDPFSKINSITTDDSPWNPLKKNKKKDCKIDIKDDVFAYATTLWEIFSRGSIPIVKKKNVSKYPLRRPLDCPGDIYQIMLEGWDPRPDLRISSQMILARLFSVREAPNSDDSSSVGALDPEELIVDSSQDESSDTSDSDSDPDERVYRKPNEFQETQVFDLPDGGKIISKKEIGRGHFGIVYRGFYELNETDPAIEVAIKTFVNNDSANQIDFEREINIMKNLKHKNIVKIITHMNEPLSIVMELVRHRSFLMYLKFNAPSLNVMKLLRFAKDIASGMEYLASQEIVHRDLAARNVLVDIDDCVKISDFGLAQKTDINGYYNSQTEREVPIKWHAPETLRIQKYSVKSDVWSFGVTLFEMFSHGSQPNLMGIKDITQVVQFELLEKGQRLNKPKQCPDDIYGLMMLCWDKTPKKRPTFTMMITIINTFIGVYGRHVN